MANVAAASKRATKTALFDEFARVGSALANGRRAEILDVLANGDRTVDGLAREVGLSLANASQHLQVLREAGLVKGRREGSHVRYGLADSATFELWRAIRGFAVGHRAEVERLAAEYLGEPDGLQPLTRQELMRRLDAGEELVLLDVRPADEYAAGHLPNAVSMPLEDLDRRLRELPRKRGIVAYCRGPYCAFAPSAVRLLRAAGYEARRLEDGLPEWKAAGLAVES